MLILRYFRGDAKHPLLYLPNLTLWYDWHVKHDTLPAVWRDWTLPQISRNLGVPTWMTARPFRIDPGDVSVDRAQAGNQRIVRYTSLAGARPTLDARS